MGQLTFVPPDGMQFEVPGCILARNDSPGENQASSPNFQFKGNTVSNGTI